MLQNVNMCNASTLQTKFEMCSFIRSKDVVWAQNVGVGHVTLTTPTWGSQASQDHAAN